MKFLKSLFGSIGAGALFIVSGYVVLTGLLLINPDIHTLLIDWAGIVPPSYIVGAGIIMGIISLWALSRVGKDTNSGATFRFDGKKGPVEISLDAIEDFLAKHFANTPIVHSIRARAGVSRDRKKIRVRASISVWSEQGLRDAGETVQEEISRCLSEGLGLDNVESVSVSVDKIVVSKTKSHRPSSRLFGGKTPVRTSVEESSGETVVKFTHDRDGGSAVGEEAGREPGNVSEDTSLDASEEK